MQIHLYYIVTKFQLFLFHFSPLFLVANPRVTGPADFAFHQMIQSVYIYTVGEGLVPSFLVFYRAVRDAGPYAEREIRTAL